MRAEGALRAAAAAEARQVREKARRLAQARRAPRDVVMSEAQRRMVQAILREHGRDTGAAASTSLAAFETEEGKSEHAQPSAMPKLHMVIAATQGCPMA